MIAKKVLCVNHQKFNFEGLVHGSIHPSSPLVNSGLRRALRTNGRKEILSPVRALGSIRCYAATHHARKIKLSAATPDFA